LLVVFDISREANMVLLVLLKTLLLLGVLKEVLICPSFGLGVALLWLLLVCVVELRANCGFVLDLTDVFVFEVLIEPVFDLADSAANEWLHFADLGPLGADLIVHH